MNAKSNKIPKHIAIIMDGNRRWAKKRGLPAVAGHKKVVDVRIEELIDRAGEVGVEYITFWAFSTENWKRDKKEVGGIMNLFRMALEKKAQRLIDKGARVKVIGDLSAFSSDIEEGMKKLMKASEGNKKITVTFALNYGGRDEIARSFQKILQSISDNELPVSNEDVMDLIDQNLDTFEISDPDLIVRTSGEHRLSGFMPWQSVYSEFYFTDVLMPDFGADELDRAIEEYGRRKRRFGGN